MTAPSAGVPQDEAATPGSDEGGAMSEMHALTLRLPVRLYEPLRLEAFNRRVPISEVIREAVDDHIARVQRQVHGGCDICGKPTTHVTTPGGMRGCDEHLRPTPPGTDEGGKR